MIPTRSEDVAPGDAPAPPARRSIGGWCAVAAVYLLVCRVMLAPLCNFTQLGSATYEGDARLVVWILAWDNHVALDGVRRPFDANTFYPAPNSLAYAEHLFGISLFTLPIYWATRNPVLAYNLAWIASFLFTALAAHALAWRYTGDHIASFAAGFGYAFCFFRMHHAAGHLQLLWGFWIPLSILALDRWLARPTWRRCAVFVAVITLQALASWYQAVMILVADGLFAAWTLAFDAPFEAGHVRWWRGSASRRRCMRFGRQAAVGALVALLCVWPFARHYTVVQSGGPVEAHAGAADFAGYLVPPQNTFAGRWLMVQGFKSPRWIWGELTLFLGWTTLLLAVIGAVRAMRAGASGVRRTRFFVLLAVASAALAFGPSGSAAAQGGWGWSPFGLLARLPGIDLFRVPARFSELVTLGLAVLAAAACAGFRTRRVGTLITAAVLPLMLLEAYVVDFPGGPPSPFPVPKIYRQLAGLAPGPVVSLPDYEDTAEWFLEANYQYFSTAHWHPIANGYSRTEPAGFRSLMDRLQTFPAPMSLAAMRETGIVYVVIHAAALPGRGASTVADALENAKVRLIARAGDDYLFALR